MATVGRVSAITGLPKADEAMVRMIPAATAPSLSLLAALAVLLGACSATVTRAPSASSPARVSQPKYGQVAVVQRGDTLYRIATGNGITALDLALWNDIAPPYTIYPGQRLRLYPGRRGVPTRPSPAAATAATSAAAPPSSSIVASAPPPSGSSGFGWRWPADGQIVGRFSAGDPTRQGLDIAGVSGQPVRAAAAGVVVYSGSGLVGYGELVIVKHDEQWLSAYGHNRTRLVNEGQRVAAGEQIAEMGRTGAARDMLHFEIRYNGKPVDPMVWLPRR